MVLSFLLTARKTGRKIPKNWLCEKHQFYHFEMETRLADNPNHFPGTGIASIGPKKDANHANTRFDIIADFSYDVSTATPIRNMSL